MRIPEHHRAAIERLKAAEASEATTAQAAEENERKQRFLAAYPELRDKDIQRALSRRISTGDLGLPFLLIDSVFAVSVTGNERGQSPDLQTALENAKDQLWSQCRHLGGDAVLFADFRLEHGVISFTNVVGVAWNVVARIFNSVSRTQLDGMNTHDRQSTLTVFAQGSAVKLLATSTQLDPRLYEQFDKRWLDLRMPPNIEIPPTS